MSWKFWIKNIKLRFQYWCNKNSGKPIYWKVFDQKNRQNGKTTLVIRDALKYGYPIVVEDRMSKIFLSRRVQDIIGPKKKVEDTVVIVTPDSILIDSYLRSGTKVLLDCGTKGFLMARTHHWKIVNGFVKQDQMLYGGDGVGE